MPVITVNMVVDKKRTIGKMGGRGVEEEKALGTSWPKNR
jgi:hypothetical protein